MSCTLSIFHDIHPHDLKTIQKESGWNTKECIKQRRTDSDRKLRVTFRELFDHLDMSGTFSNLRDYRGWNSETVGEKNECNRTYRTLERFFMVKSVLQKTATTNMATKLKTSKMGQT